MTATTHARTLTLVPFLAVTTSALAALPAYHLVPLPQTLSVNMISDGVLGGINTTTEQRATLFTPGTNTALNLDPGPIPYGFVNSQIWGLRGSQQVGRLGPSAALWNGSPDSVTLLATGGSIALDTDGTHQVGSANNNAVLWTGTPASMVTLGPDGQAYTIDHNTQAGSSSSHATLWHSTAASAVDLNPANYIRSYVRTLRDDQLVGGATPTLSTHNHAALWTGESASTFIDLNPPNFVGSQATSTNASIQVGAGYLTEDESSYHALAWTGSPDSAVDLQSYLPPEYPNSIARSIDADGTIVLQATGPTGTRYFLLALPEPTTLAIFLPLTLLTRSRRHR